MIFRRYQFFKVTKCRNSVWIKYINIKIKCWHMNGYLERMKTNDKFQIILIVHVCLCKTQLHIVVAWRSAVIYFYGTITFTLNRHFSWPWFLFTQNDFDCIKNVLYYLFYFKYEWLEKVEEIGKDIVLIIHPSSYLFLNGV